MLNRQGLVSVLSSVRLSLLQKEVWHSFWSRLKRTELSTLTKPCLFKIDSTSGAALTSLMRRITLAAAKLNSLAVKLNTFAAKLNSLAAKLNSLAEKLNSLAAKLNSFGCKTK